MKNQSFSVLPDYMCRFKRGWRQGGTIERFKTNAFYVILDSIIAYLSCRLTVVDAICHMFTGLIFFGTLNNLQTKCWQAKFFCFNKRIKAKFFSLILKLKNSSDTNFKIEVFRPKEIYVETYKLEFRSLFPNMLNDLRL